MAAATSFAIAGLALAVIGTGIGFAAQRQQAKAQEKQADAQARAQELQARRQRRQVLREQRIARGQLQNQAAQVGAQGGSGEAGGLSSLASQAGFESGFIRQTQLLGNEFTKQGRKAGKAAELGQIGSGIAGIGSSIFSASGGFQ